MESAAGPGGQERRARDQGRQRQPQDGAGECDAFDGRIHGAAPARSGVRGALQVSTSVAATMPASAATNSPSRYGKPCASSAITPAATAPTRAGRALSDGPTSATSDRVPVNSSPQSVGT